MEILLLDISKRSAYSNYVPLALLKLSTKHKSKGDNVRYIRSPAVPLKTPDIIYVSCIFPFNFVKELSTINFYAKKYSKSKVIIGGPATSILKNKFIKNKNSNVEIVEGLVPELDTYTPDYDIANVKEMFYGFTTRGCPNKCKWCVVPKIEGSAYIIPEWRNIFLPTNGSKNIVRFMDNNILGVDHGHVEEVFKFCHDRGLKIDFNQAMDCQLLIKNEKMKDIFKKYPKIWQDIRFAWDSHRVDKYAVETLKFLKENKINPASSCLWYCLYDSTDSTPEDVFNRLKAIILNPFKMHTAAKLMRFKNLITGSLDREWGMVGDMFNYWAAVINPTGIITQSTIDKWLLEKDFKIFMERLIIIFNVKKEDVKNLEIIYWRRDNDGQKWIAK